MHLRSIVYRDLKVSSAERQQSSSTITFSTFCSILQPANILLDEHGHVRISDLGLACDFSKKKPHASVGTHGYMAPEVLAKGVAYDSSADWFSFGCMIYKLLKGHSPFRQHKTKDKHEIDKMTLTMVRIFDGFHRSFNVERLIFSWKTHSEHWITWNNEPWNENPARRFTAPRCW